MDIAVLEKMNTAAQRITSAQSLEELCPTIIADLKKIIGTNHGSIYLLEKKKFERIYQSTPELQRIINSHKSYFKNILQKQTIIAHTLKKENDFKQLILVPLMHKNALVGCMALTIKDQTQLSQEFTQTVLLYATLVTLAITKIQHNEETQRALDVRDRFISVASHELRTPLTSLNGYIQLLYNKLAHQDSSEARWAKELYHECNRLTTLVKELLDINRIRQGQLAFVFSEVSMHDVVEKAIEKLQYLHSDRTIYFENKLPAKPHPIIGDKEKLREMVSALLENALKFSKRESAVTITLSYQKNSIRLQISDKGKGIPQQDLDSIFEGFYKSKHNKEREGMGVGLLLAKHVITFHKGKINILSDENRGTTVTVDLPELKT